MSPFNAGYERPALRRLLAETAGDDLAGLRILDVACSAGANALWLVEHGADVVGVDRSSELLALASRRLAGEVDQCELVAADLDEPLQMFADDAFDVVFSSLTLHYATDLSATLAELRRVLRPDGAIVASMHHPFMDWRLFNEDNYFDTGRVVDTWTLAGGGHFEVEFATHTLEEITTAFADAGFAIERLVEPTPDAAPAGDAYETLSKRPQFLFIVAHPAGR